MRLRIVMCVVALAVALGLTATVLGHPGAASAAGKRDASLTTTSTTNSRDTALPPIKHVFVIVLENESASTTFPASGAAPAPYLANKMTAEGAFLPNYYATGHVSNDNYISMISGQAPNLENTDDCEIFDNFPTDTNTGAPYYEQEGAGCIYPDDIQNIATQMDAAGLSWRSYDEDMGNDPTRESAECGHPAVGSQDKTQTEENGDAYATRHDPFVYFHNIIDNTTLCDTHVVNLNQLPVDLESASTTPNYVFITPNLCHDGHDATCDTPGEDGGFTGINDFLAKWVPMITNSPAFKDQDGLLITTFDEAATSDASSCCGELPGPDDPVPGISGAGGGRVGAVLMSPCITPGTVSDVKYNHYAMLGSVENIFGLKHIGYAQIPGESYFGTDVFNASCNGAPSVALHAFTVKTPLAAATPAAIPLRFGSPQSGTTYTLEVRRLHGTVGTPWQTLESATTHTKFTYGGRSATTYQFRVQATNELGVLSTWMTQTVVVPTYAKAAGAVLGGHWKYEAFPGAWRGHVELGSAGATYTYSYTGGALKVLATKLPEGGRVRITFDGVSHVTNVSALVRLHRRTIFSTAAKQGHHRLVMTVIGGFLPVEALVVSDLG